MPGPGPADDALERLGTLALREHSMESLLQTVVDGAKSTFPSAADVSVTLLVADQPLTTVSTGSLAQDLDESQYGRGYGPCLNAAGRGELTEVSDARTEPRWRDYMEKAVERGSLSSLSVPLPVSGLRGGLNIYARQPRAFDDDSRAAAARFAPYAGVAIANMHAYQSVQDTADNLEAALSSRAVIDQAKGILMERHRLTADQAFQFLVHASMQANRKLRDIAEHLVTTGEVAV